MFTSEVSQYPTETADSIDQLERFSTEKKIESLRTEVAFTHIITKNPQLIKILHRVKCAASQDINILLLGETGTGKDLCAQAIHHLSSRRNRPFIALNCGMGPLE